MVVMVPVCDWLLRHWRVLYLMAGKTSLLLCWQERGEAGYKLSVAVSHVVHVSMMPSPDPGKDVKKSWDNSSALKGYFGLTMDEL